jgi:hypothetical protein
MWIEGGVRIEPECACIEVGAVLALRGDAAGFSDGAHVAVERDKTSVFGIVVLICEVNTAVGIDGARNPP